MKIVKIKGALNFSSLETDSKTVYSDIGLYDFNNSYFDFKNSSYSNIPSKALDSQPSKNLTSYNSLTPIHLRK